jgi:antitoxin (DNA-binding transcriptional repressor) of toxin-antitoxin stability system
MRLDQMTTISVQDVQRNPEEILRRVEEGESLLVMRGEQPVAEFKPVSTSRTQPRPFALCAGQFHVPPSFDQPLPENILREFEGQ